jgi:hypothetical protein
MEVPADRVVQADRVDIRATIHIPAELLLIHVMAEVMVARDPVAEVEKVVMPEMAVMEILSEYGIRLLLMEISVICIPPVSLVFREVVVSLVPAQMVIMVQVSLGRLVVRVQRQLSSLSQNLKQFKPFIFLWLHF